jgi:hypothetical protein
MEDKTYFDSQFESLRREFGGSIKDVQRQITEVKTDVATVKDDIADLKEANATREGSDKIKRGAREILLASAGAVITALVTYFTGHMR